MKTQNVPPTFLMPFISFLEAHGYEIKKANPNHVPGQGYSPPPYYGNIDIQSAIDHFKDSQENKGFDPGTISDGYHTFNELYEHRHFLYIAFCKALTDIEAHTGYKSHVWRSRLHSDGTMYPGWFVLGVARAPKHQITYHLPERLWDMTEFAETQEQAPPFDGHTSADVLERLKIFFLQ